MAMTSSPSASPGRAERGPSLARGTGRSILLNAIEHRLLEQRRIVRPELLADDLVVPFRVARGAIDHVDEDPCPLDVAQERVAEPRAAAGALDQAGHVGDRRPALVLVTEVQDAEVRFERRERVVGDLGGRGGEGGEQRRLAGVRQAHEPDIGDEAQLEPQPVLLARLALLGVLGRLMGRAS